MVQLKLTLKSNRPSVVYSTNGKSYRLQPGSNTLNLEYEDYLALAKALSIKPILNNDNKEKHNRSSNETPCVDKNHVDKPHTEDNTNNSVNTKNNDTPTDIVSGTPVNEQLDQYVNEHNDMTEESPVEESVAEESPVEESVKEESPVEESVAEESNDDESVEESHEDYSTMSYTELKAKYKEVTGKSCKLKKDEIIAFLQEHSDNAE